MSLIKTVLHTDSATQLFHLSRLYVEAIMSWHFFEMQNYLRKNSFWSISGDSIVFMRSFRIKKSYSEKALKASCKDMMGELIASLPS